MLKKHVEITADHVLVKLVGKLYMEEASGLRIQLLQLFDEGNRHFVVEVHELESMDTTGLGVFISLYKRTKVVGGEVVIRGAQGSVRQLFALTGMDQVFTLRD